MDASDKCTDPEWTLLPTFGVFGTSFPVGPRPVKWCKSDDHVIHNTQLAAANSGVTSFGWVRATCAALSDSTLR
jgi:hypothetical protein